MNAGACGKPDARQRACPVWRAGRGNGAAETRPPRPVPTRHLPCDARSGDLLYSIVSRRHEHASTVITTNLAFKEWGTVFPGAACVVALVDRFTQHCHVLDIDGDSWRQRPEPDTHAPPSPARKKKKRPGA
jgi:hypothetical protein